jgi:hypothetical protein
VHVDLSNFNFPRVDEVTEPLGVGRGFSDCVCNILVCSLTRVHRLGQPLIETWITEATKWTPKHLTICDFIKHRQTAADVYVITITALQRQQTADLIRRLNFKIIVVDECHSWVRGRPGQPAAQLSEFRNFTMPKAQAVYFLSGTPFKGDLRFDIVETIKSLATPTRRSAWTVKITPSGEPADEPVNAYNDGALRSLYMKWESVPVEYKSQLLLPIMLRRTPQTTIEGKAVITDYLSLLIEMPEGRIDVRTLRNEMGDRDMMVREAGWGGSTKYLNGRLLAYSSLFLRRNWEAQGRRDPSWWDGFTLRDAEEFERGRRLVKVLKELKQRGYRPMVFAQYVFQQQFAARV